MIGIARNAAKLAVVRQGRSPVRDSEIEELLPASLGRGLLATAAQIGEHVLDAEPASGDLPSGSRGL